MNPDNYYNDDGSNHNDEDSVHSLDSDEDNMSQGSNIYDDDDEDDDIAREEKIIPEQNYNENIVEQEPNYIEYETVNQLYEDPINMYGGENDTDIDTDSDSDDDNYDNSYLQKLNEDTRKNYIEEAHPECVLQNYQEVLALTSVIRDQNNNVIDDLHKTLPYLTKYEKTRIIGQRAKQINAGGQSYVKVPHNIIDGYLIAQMELEEKVIPFIIRRPLPSGGVEYWKVKDLEVLV